MTAITAAISSIPPMSKMDDQKLKVGWADDGVSTSGWSGVPLSSSAWCFVSFCMTKGTRRTVGALCKWSVSKLRRIVSGGGVVVTYFIS